MHDLWVMHSSEDNCGLFESSSAAQALEIIETTKCFNQLIKHPKEANQIGLNLDLAISLKAIIIIIFGLPFVFLLLILIMDQSEINHLLIEALRGGSKRVVVSLDRLREWI
ncbi:hypothetical protein O181_072860 [Austropuccinia psidii MF-1]|uniref:Uncharacterized protein n=1 Tax=Austropuccinia psidii MF-1 TaxID=1389203 RepID=A0A9Q3F1C5_9BASI|nr:hypothetical protein [Austropuccinia psidii MF-1]